MVIGLVQLAAYGSEDLYLTGNPNTFLKWFIEDIHFAMKTLNNNSRELEVI